MAQLLSTSEFTPFSRLPKELRLQIWNHVYDLTPPQLIPFYLCKSDLDYLRLKRKACHDYPHIFAGRMKRVPPLLHVCAESREAVWYHYFVGFEVSRTLSMGRGETDVDTYTTCSHEIAMEDLGRGVIWDKEKDVVVLDNAEWLDSEAAAYVWGGKTGIRFGKMKRVAITCDNVMSGLGESLGWEGIDLLLVLIPDHLKQEYLYGQGRWSWGNRPVSMEEYIQKVLSSRNLSSSEGDAIEVKCISDNVEDIMAAIQ